MNLVSIYCIYLKFKIDPLFQDLIYFAKLQWYQYLSRKFQLLFDVRIGRKLTVLCLLTFIPRDYHYSSPLLVLHPHSDIILKALTLARPWWKDARSIWQPDCVYWFADSLPQTFSSQIAFSPKAPYAPGHTFL